MLRVIVGATVIERDGALDELTGLADVTRGRSHHGEQEMRIGMLRVVLEDAQTRGMRAAQIPAVQAPLCFAVPSLDFCARLLDRPDLLSE
jgi:hypothetical protein